MRLFEIAFNDGRVSEFRFAETRTEVLLHYWCEGFKVFEFQVFEIVIK